MGSNYSKLRPVAVTRIGQRLRPEDSNSLEETARKQGEKDPDVPKHRAFQGAFSWTRNCRSRRGKPIQTGTLLLISLDRTCRTTQATTDEIFTHHYEYLTITAFAMSWTVLHFDRRTERSNGHVSLAPTRAHPSRVAAALHLLTS